MVYSKMLLTFENITRNHGFSINSINGKYFEIMSDCKNEYHTDQLPVIPAGSILVADFAGDFGVYGMTQVGEKLHKIKIEINELDHVNWGIFDARNDEYIEVPEDPKATSYSDSDY